ncbi:hypothetical protein UlMin_043146 [Ulmus minor]
MTSRNFKLLMFPWLAHGHISPYLELSKKLTERNFHIYFYPTPVMLASIKPKLSEKYSQSIELVQFPLPDPNFSNILKNVNLDFLILYFLHDWAESQASSQSIPVIKFIFAGAMVVSFASHHTRNPGENFPFPEIYLTDYDMVKFRQASESYHDKIKDKSNLSSDLVLIKIFTDFEGKYMDYLSSLEGKKIVPVESSRTKVIEWLKRKERSSVVFVLFRSKFFLSKNHIKEIAHGLELSKVNFICALRFPKGEKVKIEEALPNEFLKMVGERGMVMEGWAPQGTILKSDRVGGFVSRCGWSYVMECIKFGVPIIAIPMRYDEPLNVRLVEDIGVGLEVKRDNNGEIQSGELVNVIKKVKVGEMREKLEKKGDQEMDEVVKELEEL